MRLVCSRLTAPHHEKAQIVSVFLIFLAAYRDRNYVGAATSSKLTIGTGDQDDAIAFALASNMTATDLDVSKVAALPMPTVGTFSHFENSWLDHLPSVDRKRGKSLTRNSTTALT
jgi:hypothetical protein